MRARDLILEMEGQRDGDHSPAMEAYMRDKFKFLGLRAPRRREISRPYLVEAKKSEAIDWEAIDLCWKNEYREVQYVALDYLKEMKAYLGPKDLERIELLIVHKSWWDSVDNLHSVVGHLVDKYGGLKSKILIWSEEDNIWLRRMALIHQLSLKDRTDLELLTRIIDRNLSSSEFFINKAIGWSLREYSKTDQAWVKNFLEEREDKLSRLSIREASKYL